MAEAAMFSLASKLLSTIATPAFKKAYGRVCSIWGARDDLDKLRMTIQAIQAVVLDAEKKHDRSAAVKHWMWRVKRVLYDADDLFDEVATSDMLEQQIEGNRLLKKVRVSCSKLNPIISRNSIANKVKAIRKSLLEISTDMAQFEFLRCEYEVPMSGMRKGQDPGFFVDPKNVFGREEDMKVILEMLASNNVAQDVPTVIAIVGIGGMGKTTVAQLIYNDKEVQKSFEKRWFACISDTYNEKEVIGKIFQSISGNKYNDFTVSQLQSKIRESVSGVKNFLLVLDDVWDENHGRWQDRMSLLSSGAKGSKIIVTTRSLYVARAMDAIKTHYLNSLSYEESWALFKRVAFTPEQESDPRWEHIGIKIMEKCANVPLAIKSVGSLLYTKTTIREWELFEDEELSKLKLRDDAIMDKLKLSYKYLPSNLKHCFAYCSLFGKDFEFHKTKLVYLWIAQGYIKPDNAYQNIEEAGHSYFMDLLRRCFFQEGIVDIYGTERFKMHHLIHDLAQHVAGEESITLATSSNKTNGGTRHVRVGYATDDSWVPAPLLNASRLRSLILDENSVCGRALDQIFVNLRFLRTLELSLLKIENVPSSIVRLKHLRYLDISYNPFKKLPDSITGLVNLCTLNISGCENLGVLPVGFRKLINLRHLINECCMEVKQMPPGFGELTCLQHLDEFNVGQSSQLGALVGLKLRGKLTISFRHFEDDRDDWNGVEYWHLPVTLQALCVEYYKGTRIPNWVGNGRDADLPNLTSLKLDSCWSVRFLPSLKQLPYLRFLALHCMCQLEYIEEEEGTVAADSDSKVLQYLEILEFVNLPKLKGWSKKGREAAKSLERVTIKDCNELTSFPGESLTSLRCLLIEKCDSLKQVDLPPSHLNILEDLTLRGCPKLNKWEGVKRGVDWDSLPNLRKLCADWEDEKLPDCLRHRQEQGRLQVQYWPTWYDSPDSYNQPVYHQ